MVKVITGSSRRGGEKSVLFFSAVDAGVRNLLYDTRCYFNVRSKVDMSQLNLPQGNDN